MTKIKLIAASVVMLSIALSASAAQPSRPVDININLFSQLPVMEGAELSPDGSHVAYLRPHEGRTHLAIEDLSPGGKTVIVPPINDLEFKWVQWANNDRLVFAMSFFGKRGFLETEQTRLLAVDRDGNNVKSIIKNAKRVETGSRVAVEMSPSLVQDDIISWLPDEPDYILVNLDADRDDRYDDEWFEVRKVNVNDGKYGIVQKGLPGVQNWIVDQNNEVRFGWGYRKDTLFTRYKDSNGKWIVSNEADWLESGFVPKVFIDETDIVLAQGPGDDGRESIVQINLLTSEIVKTVFEHESVDVKTLLVDNMSGAAVGVSYTVDLPIDEYFDSKMAVLQRSVDKAVPDASNSIVSMSRDRRQVLVFSISATDPGAYYHWDRDAKSFDFIGEAMPNLPVELLSAATPVSYAARDGMDIPAYLTMPLGQGEKGLPAIVLPHEGPAARSDQSFRYLTQFLVSRGYVVLQPNFRGSDGYGQQYSDAGVAQWGAKMQDDVNDGAQWLISEGIADPDRICIVGWSYGGYAAAMGVVTTPDLYKCAASINGLMDLARLAADSEEYAGGIAWKHHMGLEGENVKIISPYHQAERIQVPMLIVQSKDDSSVPLVHGKSMAERLDSLGKDVEYLEVDTGGHAVSNETARRKVLTALEDFLQENIGS